MRNVVLFCLLCCSVCQAQSSAMTKKSNQDWVEPTRWETILWQPDAPSALRESSLSGKPLMVFMFVNYKGRADVGMA